MMIKDEEDEDEDEGEDEEDEQRQCEIGKLNQGITGSYFKFT